MFNNFQLVNNPTICCDLTTVNTPANKPQEYKDMQKYNAALIAALGMSVASSFMFKDAIKKQHFDLNEIKHLSSKMYDKYNFPKDLFSYCFVNKDSKIIDNKGVDLAQKIFKAQTGVMYRTKKSMWAIVAEKAGVTMLHEIGHASLTKKPWQRLAGVGARYLPFAIPLIMLVPILSSDNKNAEKNNILQKTSSFIKNHVALLAFATSVPLLADEFFASAKAIKFLREQRSKLIGKTMKILLPAYGTYLFRALSSAFCAVVLVKAVNIRKKAAKTT